MIEEIFQFIRKHFSLNRKFLFSLVLVLGIWIYKPFNLDIDNGETLKIEVVSGIELEVIMKIIFLILTVYLGIELFINIINKIKYRIEHLISS